MNNLEDTLKYLAWKIEQDIKDSKPDDLYLVSDINDERYEKYKSEGYQTTVYMDEDGNSFYYFYKDSGEY